MFIEDLTAEQLAKEFFLSIKLFALSRQINNKNFVVVSFSLAMKLFKYSLIVLSFKQRTYNRASQVDDFKHMNSGFLPNIKYNFLTFVR